MRLGTYGAPRTIAFAVILLAIASCGDPPPSEYPSQPVYVEDTTLGPGDLFEVRVFQQPEMSNVYSAGTQGEISFPLIGKVQVTGKTPAALEDEIRRRLADGYLKNPHVSVLVKEYKSKKISVFGQVREPGTLAYSEGMNVVEAISRAGGFTAMARKNAVTVTRKIGDKATKYTVPVESIAQGKAATFYVRPGDTVFVPERLW